MGRWNSDKETEAPSLLSLCPGVMFSFMSLPDRLVSFGKIINSIPLYFGKNFTKTYTLRNPL
jgi:hypothetical protein